MPRSDRWPSRWWFWAFPAVANLYVLLLVVPWIVADEVRLPLLRRVTEFVAGPAVLFLVAIVKPVLGNWAGPWGLPDAPDLLVGLGLWELAAVLMGLGAYGGALLVHAIVGEPGREGEGNSHG